MKLKAHMKNSVYFNIKSIKAKISFTQNTFDGLRITSENHKSNRMTEELQATQDKGSLLEQDTKSTVGAKL